jgi:hypothetical protein
MRNILIDDLDALPAIASAKYWCQTLGCSRLTLSRAETAGKLKPCGPPAHKLYSKEAILSFLNIGIGS